jgi:DNA-binding XRE family transcriptional regulator
MAKKKTTDGLKIIREEFFKDDPNVAEKIELELQRCEIGQKIYDLRNEAGLTQAQLAKKVGRSRTLITRLEDADYDGHSLLMLRKVAAAVGRRVEISLPAIPRTMIPMPALKFLN